MQALAYQLSESLEVDFVLDTIKQLLREHPDAREAEAWFIVIRAAIIPVQPSGSC